LQDQLKVIVAILPEDASVFCRYSKKLPNLRTGKIQGPVTTLQIACSSPIRRITLPIRIGSKGLKQGEDGPGPVPGLGGDPSPDNVAILGIETCQVVSKSEDVDASIPHTHGTPINRLFLPVRPKNLLGHWVDGQHISPKSPWMLGLIEAL
jgi:hypothetical protein